MESKEHIISELFTIDKDTISRGQIEGLLKKAADLIRTRVDYKFILVLLFLKRVSDKWELSYKEEYKKALEDGLTEEQAEKEARSSTYHDFDLPEEFLWDNIRKKENSGRKDLIMALLRDNLRIGPGFSICLPQQRKLMEELG